MMAVRRVAVVHQFLSISFNNRYWVRHLLAALIQWVVIPNMESFYGE